MPPSRRDKTRKVMARLEAVLDELREVIDGLREAAVPTVKMSKDAVRYRQSGGYRPCSGCARFLQARGGNECTLVEGEITPDSTCDMVTAGGEEAGA